MPTNRRQPRTLLALAILELLAEGPKHPYELKQHMHQRGTVRAIPTKQASIYDTVERLTQAGFIEPLLTNRSGRRPERTVYRLTGAGANELESWLRQLIEEPSREYPRFSATPPAPRSVRTRRRCASGRMPFDTAAALGDGRSVSRRGTLRRVVP